MALTQETKVELYRFFAIAFDAAPGVEYMSQLADAVNAGMTVPEIVEVFTTKPQFTATYPNFFTNTQFATKLVENVVGNSATAAAKAEAVADIEGALGSGWTRGEVIYQIFTNLAAKPADDPTWGGTSQQMANQVAVAQFYTEEMLGNTTDLAVLRSVIANVDQNTDVSTTAAIEAEIDASLGGGGDVSLTVNVDSVSGTGANDLFLGDLADNRNTFQSGDIINGGGGSNDELQVTLGDSSNFAIRATTGSIETVVITTQSTDSNGSSGDNNVDTVGEKVTVDAEKMVGVNTWWNTDSRADLRIEDVRILDSQITRDITIGLRNTDPGSMGNKVDFEVYFSPESLRPESSESTGAITLVVSNPLRVVDGFDAAKPLDNVPYTAVGFEVNGTPVFVPLDLSDVDTYDGLAAALAAGIASVPALDGMTIERVVGGYPFFSTDGQARVADLFILRLQGQQLTADTADAGWLAEGGLPPDNAFLASISEGGLETTEPLITSTIILDNVGREDETGTLRIGSMSTHGGVERFEITVENNDDNAYAGTQSGSWLGHMDSTNNTLREVSVVNGTDGIANPDYLYVGTNMDQAGNNLDIMQDWPGGLDHASGITPITTSLLNPDGLTDVRLFDASEMEGNVYVGAEITVNAIRKYQDLVDPQVDDTEEDVAFQYLTGNGSDSINLELDATAVNSNSSVVPGRHDFSFLADGGAGNDNIMVRIVGNTLSAGTSGPESTSDWYVNHAINANVEINGGAGADTIRKPGAGNSVIDGGTGNDAIYVENTGVSGEDDMGTNDGRAVWVLNTADLDPSTSVVRDVDLQDLRGDNPASVLAVNARLTVAFQGFSKTVDIANSVGSLTNVAITDLAINQAIKDAINEDGVLSKLLRAIDGPGRTLIVESRIDGEMDNTVSNIDNLFVTFSSATQTAAQAAIAGLVQFTTAAPATSALLDAYNPTGQALFGEWGGDTTNGADGFAVSDNIITGGLGDDVIVLGTGAFDNDTVVYEGFANGTDTIVNFNTSLTQVTTSPAVPSVNVNEAFTVTFGNLAPGAGLASVTFDGSTVNLSNGTTTDLLPAADVAEQFFQDFAGLNWTATHVAGSAAVTLTRTVPGDLTPDVVAGDFVVANATLPVTLSNFIQGSDAFVAATTETFVVSFDPATVATAASDLTFDGTTVTYAVGDGEVALAAKVAAATYANWTAVLNPDAISVTFTAKTTGNKTDALPADFDNGVNGIIAGVFVTQGAAQVGTITTATVVTEAGAALDFLDFSAYDAVAVAVNGTAILGVIPTTGVYINLVESTTNDGSYTINHVNLGATTATTDNLTTVIGVADFGIEQAFVAQNFII